MEHAPRPRTAQDTRSDEAEMPRRALPDRDGSKLDREPGGSQADAFGDEDPADPEHYDSDHFEPL